MTDRFHMFCNPCPCQPCRPVRLSTFVFRIIDANTCCSLPGAVFRLTSFDGRAHSAVSDSWGYVSFQCLPPGWYCLSETSLPAGYCPSNQTHQVLVESNQCIWVDGMHESCFVIRSSQNC